MLKYADVQGSRGARGCCVFVPARSRAGTAIYDSIRHHTSAYVSIRQHTSAYVSIRLVHMIVVPAGGCVFIPARSRAGCEQILLYMCPHYTIYVSSYYYMCPHYTIYVSSYYCMCLHTTRCVRIILYMCPNTTIYVSSYYYICVLILHVDTCSFAGSPLLLVNNAAYDGIFEFAL
jgi:hypothetical protein